MRFATISQAGRFQAAIRCHDGEEWACLDQLDPGLEGDLLVLISRQYSRERLEDLRASAERLPTSNTVSAGEALYAAPYRHPRMIWGIGLNYVAHARDLREEAPSQPASFIKADHTIIGPGEDIVLPAQSSRVTAEAELGLIIGYETVAATESEALASLFGVCPILDQTAEDILQQNPRYLTRSKNFPTFFSFGPEVVTLDEFLDGQRLADVQVATFIDGQEISRNTVGNMTHDPASLIAFHSAMMPLYPGDIISSGTPGAGVISPGVVAEARIEGLEPLLNPVSNHRSNRT